MTPKLSPLQKMKLGLWKLGILIKNVKNLFSRLMKDDLLKWCHCSSWKRISYDCLCTGSLPFDGGKQQWATMDKQKGKWEFWRKEESVNPRWCPSNKCGEAENCATKIKDRKESFSFSLIVTCFISLTLYFIFFYILLTNFYVYSLITFNEEMCQGLVFITSTMASGRPRTFIGQLVKGVKNPSHGKVR